MHIKKEVTSYDIASLVRMTRGLNPIKPLMIEVSVLYYRSFETIPTLLSKGLKAWINHMQKYTMTCSFNILRIEILLINKNLICD